MRYPATLITMPISANYYFYYVYLIQPPAPVQDYTPVDLEEVLPSPLDTSSPSYTTLDDDMKQTFRELDLDLYDSDVVETIGCARTIIYHPARL